MYLPCYISLKGYAQAHSCAFYLSMYQCIALQVDYTPLCNCCTPLYSALYLITHYCSSALSLIEHRTVNDYTSLKCILLYSTVLYCTAQYLNISHFSALYLITRHCSALHPSTDHWTQCSAVRCSAVYPTTLHCCTVKKPSLMADKYSWAKLPPWLHPPKNWKHLNIQLLKAGLLWLNTLNTRRARPRW